MEHHYQALLFSWYCYLRNSLAVVRGQVISWSVILIGLLQLAGGTSSAQAPYNVTSAPLAPAAWDSGTPTSVVVPRVNSCGLLSGGRAFVQLDSGPSHATGKTNFTTPQVSVLVTFSATNANGLTPTNYTRTLSISQDKPEMQAVLDIPARFLPDPINTPLSQTSDLTVWVRVRTQGTPTGTQPPARRLLVRVEPEYTIKALPKPALTAPTVTQGVFEQTLSWSLPAAGCNLIRNYQVQILHRPILTNTSQIPSEDEWEQQGLLLETGSSTPSYKLTLAEGEGTYHWRVRALGNALGGVANPANWGEWSLDNAPFSQVAPNANLNWIYSRSFTEGGRVSEKLTFANGLQQVRQVQTRLATPGQSESALGNQVVATQVVQDYSGRDAVNGLPVPIPNAGGASTEHQRLGYKKKLLARKATTAGSDTSTYNALHFDNDQNTTVLEPAAAVERDYYTSSALSNNDRVPDAEGYPFSRTVYANDGTSRVAEQGGVGQTHHYRSTFNADGSINNVKPRTVRTDYTDVSQTELVRVFGPEAPEAAGTYKIVIQDPNGVASVTYQTKEGQTIATALALTGVVDSTLVVPLESATVDPFTVRQTISGQGRLLGKPLVLTQETTVVIDYNITPNTIAASCSQYYCSTCDYQVKLRIFNTKVPSAAALWDTTIVVPSGSSCSPTLAGLVDPRRIKLKAGAYRLERELVPLNYYPLASGSTATPKTVADHLVSLRTFLTNSTTTGYWTTIRDYLQNGQLTQLYSFLDGKVQAGQGFTYQTDSEGPYYEVPIIASTGTTLPTNCVRKFKIRVLSISCAPAVLTSYAEEFEDRVNTLNGTNGITVSYTDLIPNYSQGDVNALVNNILATAGNNQARQDEIRNCWVSLLNNLQTSVYGNIDGSNMRAYNFLDDFLECTGVSMLKPIDSSGGATISIPDAYQQFLYDATSVAHQNCFNGVYAQYLREHNRPAPTSTMSIDLIIDEFRSNLQEDEQIRYFNSIYRCIKNAQVNPPQPPVTATTRELAEEGAEQAMEECRKTCDSRRTEFLISIIEEIHRNNRYVEGDLYQWDVNEKTNIPFITDRPLNEVQLLARVDSCQLYFMAQELVDQCKRGDCNLTVKEIFDNSGQVTSYLVGTEDEQLRMRQAMFHRIIIHVDLDAKDPDCPDGTYTNVPKIPGNLYQRVELTESARRVMNYMSKVQQGASRQMQLPGRTVDYTRTYSLPGFNEMHTWNLGVTQLSNVFDYKGQILPEHLPWQRFEPFKTNLPPAQASYSIRIRDDRNSPGTRMGGVTPYIPTYSSRYDFLMLWSPNGYEGAPPEHPSGWGYSDIYPEGWYYVLRLIDEQTNQPIRKWDIQEILPGVTLLVDDQRAAGPADGFSSEFIRVRVRLTNGQTVKARILTDSYSNTSPAWPGADPDYKMFLWKTVSQQCESNNRKYTLCYRWAETLDTLTLADNDPNVFTNAPQSCAQQAAQRVLTDLNAQMGQWEQAEADVVTRSFLENCVALRNQQETFSVRYDLAYYHYSLYYYDRSGNLVKMVPPNGVRPLSKTQMDALNLSNRSTWPTPAHVMPSVNTYNSLHQLVSQESPDGGKTLLYYNSKGQLRVSQNAKQRQTGYYSYTRYDALGQPIEVGESRQDVINLNGPIVIAKGTASAIAAVEQPQYSLSNVLAQIDNPSFPSGSANGTVLRRNVTCSFYSDQVSNLTYLGLTTPDAKKQRNLLNRVSYSFLDEDGDLGTTKDRATTYYSYDSHGNVEWLVQDQPGLNRKYMRYEYDLISNKVLKVLYQENQPDQFYHRYSYNADNSLTDAYTSTDNIIWDRDAHYEYFAHGPLKRMELGEDQVQGIDYTYTLQGWLKGINHPTTDPGGDGSGTSLTATANDAFGMALGYFPGDFKSNSAAWTANSASILEPSNSQTDRTRGLYNGNIATWTNSYNGNDLSALAPSNYPTPQATEADQFRYDELNRLIRSNHFRYGSGSFAETPDYWTKYRYDENGNLLNLSRNASAFLGQRVMDRLSYSYNNTGTNQLTRVDDSVVPSDPTLYQDLKPSGTPAGEAQYKYDAQGNLIQSKDDGISLVEWNSYGKVSRIEVSKTLVRGVENHIITYRYNANGDRVAKIVQNGNQNGYYETHTTYYVYDATSNLQAIYEQTTVTGSSTPGAIVVKEYTLHGLKRLGVYRPVPTTALAAGYYARAIGQKEYELADQLGNSRALVSDIKLPNANGTYRPDLLAFNNYYPFGMMQPGRYGPGNSISSGGYRYGFNGQQQNEELGEGLYSASFWEYDSRTGRRWNLDPIQFNGISPYATFAGNPIKFKDPNGDCPICPLLAKGGAAAVADFLLQATFIYATDDQVQSVSQAVQKVDYTGVGISFLQGMIPWKVPGGKMAEAALEAVADVVINAARAQAEGKEYTWEQAQVDFIIGLAAQSAGVGVEKLLTSKKVQKLLIKFGGDKADDLIAKAKKQSEWIGNGPGCFVAGTLVFTNNGNKTIEEINVNGSLWVYNETSEYVYVLAPSKKIFVQIADATSMVNADYAYVFVTNNYSLFIDDKCEFDKQVAFENGVDDTPVMRSEASELLLSKVIFSCIDNISYCISGGATTLATFWNLNTDSKAMCTFYVGWQV